MTTTAQYLKKALVSLVDYAFDPAAQKSKRYEYEDVTPDFGHGEDAPELYDENLTRRVEELLCAQDHPLLVEGDYSGLQFLENSSQILDIVHGVDCPGSCQEKHTEWLDDDDADGFVKYCITWAWKPRYLGKGAEIPRDLHEHLRRALLMQGICEWTVIILFQSVKRIVIQREYLPLEKISRMVVAPRRRFQITDPSNIIAGTHSLFLISSLLAGDFVLDPTAEQYGIPRRHRFLPCSIYRQLYIIDLEKFCGAAVWSINFTSYEQWLQRSGDWTFRSTMRAVLDAQTAAWLQDCELRAVMDDEDRWKIKEKQLRGLVVARLEGVQPGPDF